LELNGDSSFRWKRGDLPPVWAPHLCGRFPAFGSPKERCSSVRLHASPEVSGIPVSGLVWLAWMPLGMCGYLQQLFFNGYSSNAKAASGSTADQDGCEKRQTCKGQGTLQNWLGFRVACPFLPACLTLQHHFFQNRYAHSASCISLTCQKG
jgi:hypothetical protein